MPRAALFSLPDLAPARLVTQASLRAAWFATEAHGSSVRVDHRELRRVLGGPAWASWLYLSGLREPRTGEVRATNVGIARHLGTSAQMARLATRRLRAAGLLENRGKRAMLVPVGQGEGLRRPFVRRLLGTLGDGWCLVPAATAAWMKTASGWGGKRAGSGGSLPGSRPGSGRRGKWANEIVIGTVRVPLLAQDPEGRILIKTTPRSPSGKILRICPGGDSVSPLPDPRPCGPAAPAEKKRRKPWQDGVATGLVPLVQPPRRSMTKEERPPVRTGEAPEAYRDWLGARTIVGCGFTFGGRNGPTRYERQKFEPLKLPRHPGLDVKLPTVPPPPLLRAEMTDDQLVEILGRAFFQACDNRSGGKVAAVPHRRRGQLLRSRHRAVLVEAGRLLRELEVPPSAWAAWCCDIWPTLRGARGRKLPPIQFVYGLGWIRKVQGWFWRDGGTTHTGGRVVTGPALRTLIERYGLMRAEASRGLDKTERVFRRHFPGELYQRMLLAAQEECLTAWHGIRDAVREGFYPW